MSATLTKANLKWAKEILEANANGEQVELDSLLMARAITENLSLKKLADAPYGHKLQVAEGHIPEYLKLHPNAHAVRMEQSGNNAIEVLAGGLIMADSELRL